MDILDILLAKKKSFTGETEKLTQQANEAMAKANQVAAIIQDAEDANIAAQTALEAAQTAAQEAQDTLDILQEVAIDSVSNVNFTTHSAANVKTTEATVRKDGVDNTYTITKNYTNTGTNEDGAMTQKAITNALNAQKIALETQINNISINNGESGGGNVSGDFSDATPGSYVVVGDNGNLAPSDTTENDMILTQILLGTYQVQNAVGLEIDYENKTVQRLHESVNYTAGADFNKYSMYGGRKRCIVDDTGAIVAFENDDNYIEDGSLGQVMVYQPKLYYLRQPLNVVKTASREIIKKEIILLSPIKQSGFNLHPLFTDKNNHEIDYVLLPAYEGCAYDESAAAYLLNDEQIIDVNNDKLSSIAGAKPISGYTQNFTVATAEQMAENRGEGWKLTNLAAESVNQLLMIVEFGSLNLQQAFNKGISTLANVTSNSSCLTGATSSLGSDSGMATETIHTYNGTRAIYSEESKSAISYRGYENPYGNMWRFIGGTKNVGHGNNSDKHLIYTDNQNNEHTFASALPASSNWISNFGYDKDAAWAFVPTVCENANSSVPVGDYTYINSSLNGEDCCVIGGKQSSADFTGPFYYGLDYALDTSIYSYSGRIMHIPTFNTEVYLANIEKWNNEVGGD